MNGTIHTGMYGNKAYLMLKAIWGNFCDGGHSWNSVEAKTRRMSSPAVAPSGEVVVEWNTSHIWRGDEEVANTFLQNSTRFREWIAEIVLNAVRRARSTQKLKFKFRDVTTFPCYTYVEADLAAALLLGQDVSSFPEKLTKLWNAGSADPVKFELKVACGEQVQEIETEFRKKHDMLIREFRLKRSAALAQVAKEKRAAVTELGKQLRKAVRECKAQFNPAIKAVT